MKLLRQLTPLLYGFRQDEISSLESRLRTTLDPVTPNPEFVHKLREQLLNQWGAIPHLPNSNTQSGILLIGLGVLSGFIFVIVLIRALLVFFGLFTVYREYQRNIRSRKQRPQNI